MTKDRAEVEPKVERIVAAIDPSSSVSTSVQLRGGLEFGIASGELPGGQRLPSVRALARRVGVSPVTVANVYAALQAAGHVEGRAGSGTFVKANVGSEQRRRLTEIDARIADLVAAGAACGLTLHDLSLRVSMAQAQGHRPVSVLVVGNFHDATEAYADALRPHLRDTDTIAAATLAEVEEGGTGSHDLIVVPRTLLAQIGKVAPHVEAVAVTLIPNEATRVALASLGPDSRIAGYSYFPGFVAIMKTGIQRFAPHVADLTMVVRGDEDATDRLARAEVVIYASGAGYLLGDLRPDQAAFEYRHTPDTQSIRADVLPAVEACRHQPPVRPSTEQRDAAE